MDWTQTLTIILSVFGMLLVFFFYIMGRLDANKKDTDQKIEHLGEQLSNRIDKIEKENNTRFSGIENRLTAMEVEIKNIKQRLATIEGYLVPKKIYRFVDEPEDHPKEQ